jgi:PAS domain S-box-containing protein
MSGSAQELDRQKQLLHAVNSAMAVLFAAAEDQKNFEDSILEGVDIIGRCMDVDRIHVWRNDIINDELCYVKRVRWESDAGRQQLPSIDIHPYRENPDLEGIFRRNDYINGPVAMLSDSAYCALKGQGVQSLLAIPLFMNGNFYGFFSFDDCRRERFFTEEEVEILRTAGLMIVSALYHNEAHERTQVMLDAMPLATQLWNTNLEVIDCNDETVKLFRVNDKKDFLEHFYELTPEFLPDLRRSRDVIVDIIKKTFDEGKVVIEWMHQTKDGAPLPIEVTLVRINLGGENYVASYSRDLREYRRMMKEIEKRDHLLHAVNNAATVLIQSGIEEFESDIKTCMGMIGNAVNVHRVCIWKNTVRDEKLYCTQIIEWLGDAKSQLGQKSVTDISYDTVFSTWYDLFTQGKCVNSPVRNLPANEKENLTSRGILSVFEAPVFVHDKFWGFVGFHDCYRERVFTENEELILRSGSVLIANALMRNDMAISIRETANKLEAALANYSGIIWCVDWNGIITLFDGCYLKELGHKPDDFENRGVDEVLHDGRFVSIRESIPLTFAKGRQDINSEIEGKTYRTRTTPIVKDGVVAGVMGSFDDITERTMLQKELKAALKEAQEANSAKTDFLARMSHEMRTPLNAVIGLSQLTIEAGGLSAEAYANLERINNAGTNMLSTVNDILDISKIEAGKFELVPVEYDVPSLINDAITQSIMRLESKPIEFVMSIDEALPVKLYGDDLRIKQIMNNLLSNAFKYTKEGKVELGIRCEREEDIVEMIICVKDTGIGIRSEEIDELFLDYTQADIKLNRKIEGTGLGLPIVKKLVEMMDGTVSVKSEYGKGSEFTVTIDQKFVTDEIIGNEVVESLKNFHYLDHKLHQNLRMTRVSLPYARVLVVDDVTTNLDVARGMLKPYGMHIDCVKSGREAVDIIRKEKIKYNAIFMDHMMPEMDGIEATRIIREEVGTEYAKNIPIIALTANAIMGNEEMFLSKGFQAFLPKPVDIPRLDAIVRQWIRDESQEEAFSVVEIIESEQETNFGRSLDGINLQKGFEFFNYDKQSYISVLRSYVTNTPPMLDSIKTVKKDDLEKYTITVHSLKGSSLGICAENVGAMAEALEHAAKKGDFDYIEKNNSSFVSEAGKLITHLEGMLDDIAKENPKPKKDEPSKETLDKLYDACNQYNMDMVDEAINELDSYEYNKDGELVEWLKENVEKMNFTEIKERLSGE